MAWLGERKGGGGRPTLSRVDEAGAELELDDEAGTSSDEKQTGPADDAFPFIERGMGREE